MGQVSFQTAMSGGRGDLQITFDNAPNVLLTFNEKTINPQIVTLPYGVNNYTVTGNAAPGGNIHLIIRGDVLPITAQDFGPGLILSQSFPAFVTV
ncbi:hypothetical protein [Mucilaginibacter sp. OK098]|uniref:hypothetical protein n=1 Tax=Mucilaginibacter sp. OK098 TaxID=1855297 RepID=UPI00091EA2A5|nr:hypothetical protein [Mucilaginibacter sp. OK098]SHN07436.1 hypothetical protein SAMN05216524_10539 [Mucilaginibacter sp. OK098]